MMRFETWWGKVLARAEEFSQLDGGPLHKLLSFFARATVDRSMEVVEKFELDTTKTPWALRLKDSIVLEKHCRGGNDRIPEIECHSFAVIPRLTIALEPDEVALAIHSLYTGTDVPDLSGVKPSTTRLQDWFLFAAIAEYPRFRSAVVDAWGKDSRAEVSENVDRGAR